MKTRFKLFLLTMLSFVFFTCEKNDVATIESIKTIALHNNVVAKILGIGFDTTGITEMDDYYLVEGDVLISKKQANDEHNNLTERQYHTYDLSETNTIFVKWTGFGEPYYTAIQLACLYWTNITGCAIVLSENYNNYDILVRDDGGSLSNTTHAVAEFPLNSSVPGSPGNLILVNTDFECSGGEVTLNQAIKLFAHELGHCLGFRHTNWIGGGEPQDSLGAIQIPGTPGFDANSVFNGGTACSPWNGFSNYDIIGAQYLYPTSGCNDPGVFYHDWLISPNGGDLSYTSPAIVWNTSKFSGESVRLELLFKGAFQNFATFV